MEPGTEQRELHARQEGDRHGEERGEAQRVVGPVQVPDAEGRGDPWKAEVERGDERAGEERQGRGVAPRV
ncbi:MAG TPA: hypothetical protein VNE71_10980, partial [Myxococcota bacterium]|nr:hypothetical protein [Myxococcota bacterium]